MSGNPYEIVADEVLGNGPPPPKNPYDDIADDIFGDPQAKLRSSLDIASRVNPDEQAKAVKAASVLSVPVDSAKREPVMAQQEVARRSIDYDALLSESPNTSAWISKTENSTVAHDDLESLTGLEYLFGPGLIGTRAMLFPGAVQRSIRAGVSQRTLADLQGRAADLRIDPEAMPGYSDLLQASQTPDTTGRNPLSKMLVGTAGILPGVGMGFVKGAAAAAVTEMGIAAAGGPAAPATAAAGLLGPSELAFLLGIGKDTYDQERAGAYAEAVKRMKASGGKVDYELAARRANAAGLMNAALEVGGTKLLFAILPVIGKVGSSALGRTEAGAAAKAAVASPAGPIKSVLKAAWRMLAGTTEESVTEGLQRAETISQVETSVEESGGKPDFSRLGPETAAEVKGAFESMFLLGAFGAAGNLSVDIDTYKRSQENKARTIKLGEIVQASRLAQRMPEKMGEFAGELVKSGAAPENVYVPIADFVSFFSEKGLDPSEVAKQIGLSESYSDAVVSRADLAIPFNAYVEKFAGQSFHRDLAEHVKFDPNDMTPKQANEFAATVPERIDAVAKEMAAQIEDGASAHKPDDVDEAQRKMAAAPMFEDMDAAGMTLNQWAQYRDTTNTAVAEAREKFSERLFRETKREQLQWWREESERVSSGVANEVDSDSRQQAGEFLRNGTMLDGRDAPADIQGAKLSKADIIDLFGSDEKGQAVLRRLGTAVAETGGVHPDLVAPLFGYKSGSSMVRAILTAGSRERAIARETRRVMLERHGKVVSDASVAETAEIASHTSEARAKQYEMEYAALTRKAGKSDRITPARLMSEAANRQVDRQRVRDLDPRVFLNAEAKANRAARGFERAGDFDKARTEVQRAMLNHFLYRSTVSAREEMSSAARFLARSDRDSVRAKLGKAGANYLDRQDQFLEDYEFKRPLSAASRDADRRQGLREWIAEQESLAQQPEIADWLLDESKKKSWTDLSVQQLRDLRDAVQNNQALANLKNTLLQKGARRDEATGRAELIAAAESNLKDRGPLREDRNVETRGQAVLSYFAEKDADLLRIETMLNWLDGGDKAGPWHRMILDTVQDAKHKELDLERAITKQISDLMQAFPKQIRAGLDKQVAIEGIGQRSRLWLMALALNTGNESNLEKLMGGHKWSRATIEQARARLTAEEMDYVQGIWNVIDGLKPEAAALYKRRTGLEFPEVKAQEFTHQGKTYRGGYFPVKYDRSRSIQGESQVAETVAQFFESDYPSAHTARGYTKDRNENFARPFDLRLAVIPNHIAQVIHDIAFGEAVASIGKILLHPEIRATMQQRLGEERAQAFLPWLKGVANYQAYSVADASSSFDKFMETRRSKTTAAVLALKMTIATGNLANMVTALRFVRPDYLAKGALSGLRHPVLSWRQARDESGEIRHRMSLFDRDMREQQRQLQGRTDWYSNALRFGYAFTAFTDVVTSVPIYNAAKMQALAGGADLETAVRAGEAAVRDTVGSGHPVDLPRIMRARGMSRAITMFYGYANSQYNALRSSLTEIEKARLDRAVGKRLPYILAQATAVIVGNAIIGEILASRGPGDDDPWSEWLLRKTLLYPFETIPGLRDTARFLEGVYEGKEFGDFSFSPLAKTFEKAAVAVKELVYDIPMGEKEASEVAFDVLDAGTLWFGVPGQAQLKTTGVDIYDLLNGNQDLPQDAQSLSEFVHDLAYPRPPERK